MYATAVPLKFGLHPSKMAPALLSVGRADASGRFRLDAVGTPPAHHEALVAVASAERHGIG